MENEIRKYLLGLRPDQLVTSHENTRAGFLRMAFEKNLMAKPYVDEARVLRTLASRAKTPTELLGMGNIRSGLLAASGLSDKALGHLNDDDINHAIRDLVEQFLEPAGTNFVDELVYRFLLTKGDAIGGKMRNLAGVIGDRKLSRSIINVLSLSATAFAWRDGDSNVWLNSKDGVPQDHDNIKALFWEKDAKPRLLITNIKLPLINKNVDVSILEARPEDYTGSSRGLLRQNHRYIALGELKAGVDPAGSDEHWKTAKSALNLVRKNFQEHGLNPFTFFIGAAIGANMANEICSQLKSQILDHVANLTNEDQLALISEWIVNSKKRTS